MLLSFKDLVKKYDMRISGIIHIGAHYGEEVQDYIDEGVQDMLLFEPLSENFSILEQNVKNLNGNIEGYQVALGTQREGTTTMYVSDNEKQSSSILKPKVHCEVNRDEVYENNAYVEEIDEFLAGYGMERVETDWEGEIWGDALYIRTK